MDISWISSEAKTIHDFFVSIFYILATILLALGVLIEYFKMPMGGVPAFSQLIGRVLIAAILMIGYPEISNTAAQVADAVAEKLETANTTKNVIKVAGEALKTHSWSIASLGDTFLSVVSYLAYYILYITVFFFNAAMIYCLVLLYVFSPVLTVFYILPQTAGMTGGLFRSLFEVVSWKIVFAVLGTLLWSTSINNFRNGSDGNFITLLALTLMLAFSIVLTPLVVKNLISGAISSIATQTAGLAAIGLSAGTLSPAAMAGMAKVGTSKAAKWGASRAWQGTKKAARGARVASKYVRTETASQVSASGNDPSETVGH